MRNKVPLNNLVNSRSDNNGKRISIIIIRDVRVVGIGTLNQSKQCQIFNPSVPRGSTEVEWIFAYVLKFCVR